MTAWAVLYGGAAALPDLRIAEVEVKRPGAAILGRLPAPVDPPAIRGERAGEPLRERQRSEVRGVPKERPHAVTEIHRIEPGDAPRVEVMLAIRLTGRRRWHASPLAAAAGASGHRPGPDARAVTRRWAGTPGPGRRPVRRGCRATPR